MTLGRHMGLAAVYLERYGLSLVFLVMAGFRIYPLVAMGQAERSQIAAAPLTGILSQLIWIQLYLYVGLLLLFGRRVTSLPQTWKDLVVPMGATFFFLTYNVIPWLPMAFQKSLCPAGWQSSCVALGSFFNLAGIAVTVWAAIHLGRSFGILIEVRKPVMQGAYRWVRHPMYVGDLCLLAGLAIASFSAAMFVLVPAHIALLLYRARLEEARLAEVSPEYAEYRKKTGFVFPKFG